MTLAVRYTREVTNVVWYTREVINVGDAGSVYKVAVEAPSTVALRVGPSRLVFGTVGEKKRYSVLFVAKNITDTLKAGSLPPAARGLPRVEMARFIEHERHLFQDVPLSFGNFRRGSNLRFS